MSNNFTADKYTAWLIPVNELILFPDFPLQAKRSEQFMFRYHTFLNIERGAWPALAVAVVLWLAFMMKTRIQKVRWGHAHLYLTIWLLCCFPTPLFINNYWIDLQLQKI